MLLVGGVASLVGPAAAAIVIVMFSEYLEQFPQLSAEKYMVIAVIMVIVLRYFPGGLAQLANAVGAKVGWGPEGLNKTLSFRWSSIPAGEILIVHASGVIRTIHDNNGSLLDGAVVNLSNQSVGKMIPSASRVGPQATHNLFLKQHYETGRKLGQYGPAVAGLGPNIARPTLNIFAPSSMAIS